MKSLKILHSESSRGWGGQEIRTLKEMIALRDLGHVIELVCPSDARIGARSLRKTLLKLELVPRWLRSRDFRLAFTSGVSANKVCFERELLDHYRLVFEKRT